LPATATAHIACSTPVDGTHRAPSQGERKRPKNPKEYLSNERDVGSAVRRPARARQSALEPSQAKPTSGGKSAYLSIYIHTYIHIIDMSLVPEGRKKRKEREKRGGQLGGAESSPAGRGCGALWHSTEQRSGARVGGACSSASACVRACEFCDRHRKEDGVDGREEGGGGARERGLRLPVFAVRYRATSLTADIKDGAGVRQHAVQFEKAERRGKAKGEKKKKRNGTEGLQWGGGAPSLSLSTLADGQSFSELFLFIISTDRYINRKHTLLGAPARLADSRPAPVVSSEFRGRSPGKCGLSAEGTCVWQARSQQQHPNPHAPMAMRVVEGGDGAMHHIFFPTFLHACTPDSKRNGERCRTLPDCARTCPSARSACAGAEAGFLGKK